MSGEGSEDRVAACVGLQIVEMQNSIDVVPFDLSSLDL